MSFRINQYDRKEQNDQFAAVQHVRGMLNKIQRINLLDAQLTIMTDLER